MIDDIDDDDEPKKAGDFLFFAFDCPDCDANNPMDDGFRSGDEVQCSYCGLDWLARASDDGKLKLREA